MHDALSQIIAMLTPWEGCSVYRGQLPKGYDNTHPAVVVTMNDDNHHQTGSTRRAVIQFRVYGGAASATTCAAWYGALCDKLTNASGDSVLRVGELSGQELPADPVTGWPAYLLRAAVRITER